MANELIVYGDESGIEPSQPYCVIAGFIASPKHWDTFNGRWRRILDEAGVAEFHSIYFFNRYSESRSNPYSGWSGAKAEAFHSELWQVINDHHGRVTPIGCAMDTVSFLTFPIGERRLLTGGEWNKERGEFRKPGSPRRTYFVPFFNMVSEALEAARPPDCEVHFVMDEQKIVQNHIQAAYMAARDDSRIDLKLRQKMGNLTPGRSEDYEGIQAADLIAHTWYSTYSRPALRGARLDAFNQLMKRNHRQPGVIKTRGLEEMLKPFDSKERRRIQAL